MPPPITSPPKTFYLNEQHELSRGERGSRGRLPQYHGIDWAAKGQHIKATLDSVKAALTASADPLTDRHYFVLAKPVPSIQKKSTNKKLAQDGVITSQVHFNEDDSRVFRRLGMDLVEVTPDGSAVVHIEPERIKQLLATTQRLDQVGAREQARWASLDGFGMIPSELRLNDEWVRSLRRRVPSDAVVEFQPLLSRFDFEVMLRAIAVRLKVDLKEGITAIGTDFSGRFWARGRISPESLRSIAKDFYSVQTLHSPLLSSVAAVRSRDTSRAKQQPPDPRAVPDVNTLPSVALLDTGVPQEHSRLASYRRGAYIAPDSFGQPVGDHGTFVASRIVFGDVAAENGVSITPGTCRYYDALVASAIDSIDDKSVVPAIQTVVGTAPDVRVFNLSFDTAPLELLDATKRRENLLLVQDLDNLVFRDDIVVVVSAGNSKPGVVSAKPYPGEL